MVNVARRIVPGYDIHQRMGLSPSLSIPNKDVAGRIVDDMSAEDRLLPFVELLIAIHRNGFVGRRMPIPGLSEVLAELSHDGYGFDSVEGTFREDAGRRRTSNWGVLRRGEDYHLAFIAIDVVGNSRLVKRFGRRRMEATYADLRGLVTAAVEKRDGRLWSWEGDGGLAAFFTGEVGTHAVQSGMEILHELVLYNALWNELPEPVAVRLAVHSGQVFYNGEIKEIEHSVPVKTVRSIEADFTMPNSLTATPSVYGGLEAVLQSCFVDEVEGTGSPACRRYSIEFV